MCISDTFWTWFTIQVAGNMFLALVTPVALSLALEPMGELAGTASGILGLSAISAASLLAALVGMQLGTTTTPWAVGFVVYATIGLGFLVAAGRTPEQDPGSRPAPT